MIDLRRTTSAVVLAAGGPAALGAALGLRRGLQCAAATAGASAAMWLALTALMAPALYIGASLLGLPAEAARTPRAMVRGLRASALTLLGLCPATVLLICTATGDPRLCVVLFGGLASAGAALVGLRVTSAELLAGRNGVRGHAFLAAWSVVGLALGAVLFLRHVASGGSAPW